MMKALNFAWNVTSCIFFLCSGTSGTSGASLYSLQMFFSKVELRVLFFSAMRCLSLFSTQDAVRACRAFACRFACDVCRVFHTQLAVD